MTKLLIKGEVSVTSPLHGRTYGIIREKGFIRPFRSYKGEPREYGLPVKESEFVREIGSGAVMAINALQAKTAGTIERASAARSFAWAFGEKFRQDRRFVFIKRLLEEIQPCGWGNVRKDGVRILADHTGTLMYNRNGVNEFYQGVTTCEISPSEAILEPRDFGCLPIDFIFKNLNYRPI